jgi:hypothetical protein
MMKYSQRLLGADGELVLAGEGLSIRCLQRADGGLAEVGEQDSSLVAVVGRAY